MKDTSPTNSAETRNLKELDLETNNIYKSIVIMSRRANQIQAKEKEEISNRLSEFSSVMDNMEEIIENREQIELSKYYERLPKPSLRSFEEFTEDKLFYRTVDKTTEESI